MQHVSGLLKLIKKIVSCNYIHKIWTKEFIRLLTKFNVQIILRDKNLPFPKRYNNITLMLDITKSNISLKNYNNSIHVNYNYKFHLCVKYHQYKKLLLYKMNT